MKLLERCLRTAGILSHSHRSRLRRDELASFIENRRSFSSTNFKKCSTKSEVRVRFAPSPTGELHLGGFRTALYNYLFAKKYGGKFLLRIEDTDQSRLVPGAASQLESILDWIGTKPDESPTKGGESGPYVQSQRLHLYHKYVNEMIENGSAYRCFCTEKRLDILRKESAKMKTPNVYDQRCLHLSAEEKEERLKKGDSYTVRFKLSPFPEGLQDLIHGEFHHDVHSLEGDPIILKSDGFPTYHLACVVDDHLMNISHVLRGVEWQVSTPKHILMYHALGWTPPQYGHLPLILNPDGSKLSKRQNALNVRSLREAGYQTEAILNFVSLIGGGFDKEYSLKKLYSMEELIQSFDVGKINQSAGRIEMERLDELNNNLLKQKFESNKEDFLKECKQLILSEFSEADVESNLEVKIAYAIQRINTIKDLIKPEFRFLWNIDCQAKDELTCDAKQLTVIMDLFKISDDFKLFQFNLRKYCKTENLKMPVIMKDIRIMLIGRGEGAPIKEIVDLIGHQNSLKRMRNSLG